ERVPAHRLQHVPALHALVAADHVADGAVAHMAHVQATTRVGEHRQAIEFFLAGLFAGLARLRLLPVLLGLLFYLFGTIVIFHGARLLSGRISRGHRIHDRRAGRQRRGPLAARAWALGAAGVLCRLVVIPDREQQQCCPSTPARTAIARSCRRVGDGGDLYHAAVWHHAGHGATPVSAVAAYR